MTPYTRHLELGLNAKQSRFKIGHLHIFRVIQAAEELTDFLPVHFGHFGIAGHQCGYYNFAIMGKNSRTNLQRANIG